MIFADLRIVFGMHIGSCLNQNLATRIGSLHWQSRVKVPFCVNHTIATPGVVANLPLNLAALLMTNVSLQTPVEKLVVIGKKEHLYHATMKYPHKTAELKLDQIWQMIDRMLEAHSGRVPELR